MQICCEWVCLSNHPCKREARIDHRNKILPDHEENLGEVKSNLCFGGTDSPELPNNSFLATL